MTGPGESLLNFMADKLREFLIDHDLLHKRHFLGFTFSFPTVQHSLRSADLATWTKVCLNMKKKNIYIEHPVSGIHLRWCCGWGCGATLGKVHFKTP